MYGANRPWVFRNFHARAKNLWLTPRLVRIIPRMNLKSAGAGLAALFLAAAMPDVASAPYARSALVVFTGGETRVASGLRQFMKGTGDLLLITGIDVQEDAPTLLERYNIPRTRPLDDIRFDRNARDTVENAQYTARWMREHGIGHMTLITSDFHISRSLRLLHSTNAPRTARISACAVTDDMPADVWETESAKDAIVAFAPAFVQNAPLSWRKIVSGTAEKFANYMPRVQPMSPAPPC